MDVQLPDGTVVKDVPEGTTKAQLVEKLQRNGMNVPAEWAAEPKKADGKPMSRAEKTGFGMMDPIHGGAQLLEKMIPQPILDAGNKANNWIAEKTGLLAPVPEGGVDQMVREREAQYQANREASGETGFDGYRTLGNVASPANLAIAAKAPAALTLAGRMGVGAGTGALSSALNPVAGGGDYLTEKAKQVGLGATFGGVAPALLSGVARLISPKASTNPQLSLLREEGVKPTVGQSLGGWANRLEERAQSLPVVGDAISNARKNALEQFNEAAINRATAPIGQRVQGSGQSAVTEAGDALSQAYDDALANLKVVRFDQQFAQEAKQLKGLAKGLLPEMRKKFNNTLEDVVGGRTSQTGGITAEAFKKAESEIGQKAAQYRSSSVASERELGDALTQLQSLMKQQVGRASPDAAKALAAADEGWANLVRVEGASKAAANSDGLFTPGQLNTAIRVADKSTRKRAVARGEALMQDLGSAGQNVLGNKVPDSGTAGRLLFGGGALGGLYALEPTAAAGLLGSAVLYTPQAQALLRYAVANRPELAGPIAEALKKASPALVPATTQVGLELSK
jgi:hypothetical protein